MPPVLRTARHAARMAALRKEASAGREACRPRAARPRTQSAGLRQRDARIGGSVCYACLSDVSGWSARRARQCVATGGSPWSRAQERAEPPQGAAQVGSRRSACRPLRGLAGEARQVPRASARGYMLSPPAGASRWRGRCGYGARARLAPGPSWRAVRSTAGRAGSPAIAGGDARATVLRTLATEQPDRMRRPL
jgi:hypothetical protein